MRCIVSYAKLLKKLRENNVTHPTLFVCHANRAVAYLNLGLFEEAVGRSSCSDARQRTFHADAK